MKHTIVIAEAGVNHNGNIDIAIEMVHAAARAGADFVKFQTFNAQKLATAQAPKAEYQNAGDNADTQLDMLRRLELTTDDFVRLADECRRIGIGFMSTPFDIASVDLLSAIGQEYWKIPSGELTNLPLLRHIAHTGRRIILSTGMATLPEVRASVDALVQAGASPADITLLHCTTAYPTEPTDVNLAAMHTLRTLGTGSIGYSDHTRGIAVPIAAVALGADIIEKHFTLDRTLPGPDHAASLTPDELTDMVNAIRTTEQAIGNPEKQPCDAERANIAAARKSIVAARHITRGQTITADDITTKRPGTGLSPMLWDTIVGTTAPRDYAPDDQL